MQVNFDNRIKVGLNIYVNDMLISNEFELISDCLIFVKVVVEMYYILLNVNQEKLQESKTTKVIPKKLLRKAIYMMCNISKK